MKVPSRSGWILAGVAGAILAVGAWASGPELEDAESDAAVAIAASEAEVLLLVASCANCHGTVGQGGGAIPPLAGRPYEYLRDQLFSFRSNQSPTATVMNRLLGGYADEELEAIARHFAALPVGGGQ